MQALDLYQSDLSVDEIIERVLIRNNEQPYDYTNRNSNRITQPEHLWHYQLQEENQQLKEKLKKIKSKLKKEEGNLMRESRFNKEIVQLRKQLENVLNQNAQLQREINKMRLKNTQINDSIRQSLEESQKRNKKQCICAVKPKESLSKQRGKNNKNQLFSPSKPTTKITKNKSIICDMGPTENQQSLQAKKKRVNTLQRILESQQKLLQSYSEQMNHKTLQRKHTMPSTSQFKAISRPTSQTTFKPASLAGSIVKIKRKIIQ